MIPNSIVRYLQGNSIPFTRHWHPRAVAAPRLAQALHASGREVAKSVLVTIDGRPTICVVPANMLVDERKLAEAMNGRAARVMDEDEFVSLFEDCEVGAEPPFGHLYKLPVVLDSSFKKGQRMLFRAGSHEETLEMGYDDYLRLEQPTVVSFGYYESPMPRSMRIETGPVVQA